MIALDADSTTPKDKRRQASITMLSGRRRRVEQASLPPFTHVAVWEKNHTVVHGGSS